MTTSHPALTLPDELTLLGRTTTGGRFGNGAPAMAVAAGELAELAFAERITLDTKYASVVDPTPLGDPLLDAALAELCSRSRHRLVNWMSRSSRAYQWRLDALVARGLLRHDVTHVLKLFPVHKYVPDAETRTAVLTRLWHMLRGWREPDTRTGSLAAIVQGSQLGYPLFPEKQDRRALKHFARPDVLAKAVGASLASASAAANVAAISASVAASASAANCSPGGGGTC